MSQQGGPSYDGEAMKAVASATRELSAALGQMKEYAVSKTTTAASFGNIADATRVSSAFEDTWANLAQSLAKGAEHIGQLARSVESSFVEQDTRDEESARDLRDSAEGLNHG